jgi:hypothetical protein
VEDEISGVVLLNNSLFSSSLISIDTEVKSTSSCTLKSMLMVGLESESFSVGLEIVITGMESVVLVFVQLVNIKVNRTTIRRVIFIIKTKCNKYNQ